MNRSHIITMELGCKFELKMNRPNHALVSISAQGLNASKEFYYLNGLDGLLRFFEELDMNVGASEAKYQWESLEGELQLKAETTIVGAVSLDVTLRNNNLWMAQADFVLEPHSITEFIIYLKQLSFEDDVE